MTKTQPNNNFTIDTGEAKKIFLRHGTQEELQEKVSGVGRVVAVISDIGMGFYIHRIKGDSNEMLNRVSRTMLGDRHLAMLQPEIRGKIRAERIKETGLIEIEIMGASKRELELAIPVIYKISKAAIRKFEPRAAPQKLVRQENNTYQSMREMTPDDRRSYA